MPMKRAASTIEEVKKILKEHKAEVSRKYKVSEIGIFGSFVRGEQKKRSDIDILVEFDQRNIPGLLKFIEMERYLEKLLRKKVDLVRKGGIRPQLKKIILKEVVYI
ncbi:MAG: nucleotidyltransferase family protein [Thermodesulfovibrionales bacterium]|nr:nucleotidyltransferase family protein [Thermodesulfovibrionales bacterium]